MALRTHEAFGLNSQEQQLLWWDDFLGDSLDDRWTSAGDAGGSGAVVDAQTGGIVRITTDGDNTDEWILSWNDIRSLHADKNVCMEIKLVLGQTTNQYVRICLYFDGSNYFRFLLSSLGAATNWGIQSRSGGVSTEEDSGILADTDEHIFRIESTSTSVSFYIDDVECANSPITTNICNSFMQPMVWCTTRENAVKTYDVDYVTVRQDR